MEYNDSIYGHQKLSSLQEDLSSIPELENTDRLKQLGMSVYVYRTAKHTRFDHAIGASRLASIFIKKLGIDETEKHIIEAALELHDIKHLPYCHAAQSYWEEYHNMVHEPLAEELIRNSKNIQEIFQRYSIDTDSVCRLINKRKDEPVSYMTQLVSGTMDCDRLDYLMRDSMNTASHGLSLERNLLKMIDSMDLYKDVIRYSQDASQCIINFMNVYMSMYIDVYHNRNTAALEKMLVTSLEMKHRFTGDEDLGAKSEDKITRLLLSTFNKDIEEKTAQYLATQIFKEKKPYKDIFSLMNHERNRDIIRKIYLKYPIEKKSQKEKEIEKHLCKEMRIPQGHLLVLANEIMPEGYKSKTDIFIKPYGAGLYEPEIIRIEDAITIPLIDKRFAHKLPFRVIVSPDYQNDIKISRRIKEILLNL